MEKSLFERIGGEKAVEATVDIFYQKISADPHVNSFFRNTDMKRQKHHQKIFLTYAFGGMPYYTGKSMWEAHKRLVDEEGLNDNHFDRVAKHLHKSLKEMKVPKKEIKEILDIVESVRDKVLNREKN